MTPYTDVRAYLSMFNDTDLRRAAMMLMSEYGPEAGEVAARFSLNAETKGLTFSARSWSRIRDIISENEMKASSAIH